VGRTTWRFFLEASVHDSARTTRGRIRQKRRSARPRRIKTLLPHPLGPEHRPIVG